MNYLNNKKVGCGCQYFFTSRFQKEKIFPDGLNVRLEPSICNCNKEFLKNWHERLQSFTTLMSDVLTFCKNTIDIVSLEITEHKKN